MNQETVNNELITLARKYRGLTQTALSRQAGVTQGYLSKVEQNVMSATPELIEKVARATDLPASFFVSGHRLYGLPVSVHPMFRKKASVPAKILDAIHAEVNIRIMHLRRLLESAEISPEFELPRLDIDDFGGDADEIARILRGQWLVPPGPITNLTGLVERAGCVIIHSDFGGSDIDGVTLDVPGMPPTIFLSCNRPGDRQRFTLAHELGHLVMHRLPTPDMETEANRFASALLMPRRDISPHLTKPNLQTFARLKPIWRVSMAALLTRATALNKLTSTQTRSLWRQMAPYRRKEPDALDIAPEQPHVLPDLIRIHTEELGYSIDELSSILHMNSQEISNMYQIGGGHLRLVK